MGVFTIQYETVVRPQIEAAIRDALGKEVKEAALLAITNSAQTRVYDVYKPKTYVRRKSLICDDTYSSEVNGNTLTITAHPVFSGDDDYGDLGDVIASGNPNFNMPFPRPWMDEGIEESMQQITDALYSGMHRQGF